MYRRSERIRSVKTVTDDEELAASKQVAVKTDQVW